eukprot:tig00000889_g5301.t1
MSTPMSIIQDLGPSSSTCGYCHTKEEGRLTHGMWAHMLTCDDYQALIDRGWRRSGLYVYKPHMRTICCPQYTIRLEAEAFRPSKKHRRVLRRMEQYLAGEWTPRPADARDEADGPAGPATGRERRPSAAHSAASSAASRSARALPAALLEALRGEVRAALEAAQRAWAAAHPEAAAAAGPEAWRAVEFGITRTRKAEHGEAACNAALALSSRLRRALQPPAPAPAAPEEKQKKKQKGAGPPGSDAMEIATLVAAQLCAAAAGRPIAAVAAAVAAPPGFVNLSLSAAGKELAAAAEAEEAEEEEEREAERAAAESAAAQAAGPSRVPPTPRKLEVAMVEPAATDETFELYKKYQVAVHGDKPESLTREGFTRFLVSSPLIRERAGARGADPLRPRPPLGFGSFHQEYRVEGRLVAVGVVDVLPRCLSSVYFYYDPDLRGLDLGTWGALREIEWVQRVGHPACAPLAYYYLGYYIHSCPKMRYKGQYEPSELLCPEECTWHPLGECAPRLDAAKYSRFAPLRAGPAPPALDVAAVPVLVARTLVPFGALRRRLGAAAAAALERRLGEYGALVGTALARRMAFVLPGPGDDDEEDEGEGEGDGEGG